MVLVLDDFVPAFVQGAVVGVFLLAPRLSLAGLGMEAPFDQFDALLQTAYFAFDAFLEFAGVLAGSLSCISIELNRHQVACVIFH